MSFVPANDGTWNISISVVGDELPDWIQLFALGKDVSLEHLTSEGTIANPAESDNDGMLAVGALVYPSPTSVADYSSRGPTADWDTKPDILGMSHVSTEAYEKHGFAGTSAAAPHVAGLAALLLDYNMSQGVNPMPSQTVDYLKNAAVYKGPATNPPDNTRGYGRAVLDLLDPSACDPNANHEPTLFLDLRDITLHQGSAHKVSLIVQDHDMERLTYTASSSNTDVLTVGPSSDTVMDPLSGIFFTLVHLQGGGISLNPQSAGSSTVTVNISDCTASLTTTFSVTVTNNHYPELERIDRQDLTIAKGAIDVTLSAEDKDGDDLTFTYIEPVAGLDSITASLAEKVLTLTPIAVGWDPLLVEVRDELGASDWDLVVSCVEQSNADSRLAAIEDITVRNGDSTSVTISATDADGTLWCLRHPIQPTIPWLRLACQTPGRTSSRSIWTVPRLPLR